MTDIDATPETDAVLAKFANIPRENEWEAVVAIAVISRRLERQRNSLAESLRKIETLEENSDDKDFESLVVQMQTIARSA